MRSTFASELVTFKLELFRCKLNNLFGSQSKEYLNSWKGLKIFLWIGMSIVKYTSFIYKLEFHRI
jgi:hypothetical protein